MGKEQLTAPGVWVAMRRISFSYFGNEGNASRITKSECPRPRSDGLRCSDFSRYSVHLYVRRIQSDDISTSSRACNNARANTVASKHGESRHSRSSERKSLIARYNSRKNVPLPRQSRSFLSNFVTRFSDRCRCESSRTSIRCQSAPKYCKPKYMLRERLYQTR